LTTLERRCQVYLLPIQRISAWDGLVWRRGVHRGAATIQRLLCLRITVFVLVVQRRRINVTLYALDILPDAGERTRRLAGLAAFISRLCLPCSHTTCLLRFTVTLPSLRQILLLHRRLVLAPIPGVPVVLPCWHSLALSGGAGVRACAFCRVAGCCFSAALYFPLLPSPPYCGQLVPLSCLASCDISLPWLGLFRRKAFLYD